MARQTDTEAEMIRKTAEHIHSFYSRDKDVTTAPMADNFMWIGANDFQWCQGPEAFAQVTKKEYDEPPVLLSNEEYHLLFHERGVWVVYGRYTAKSATEDGGVLYAHVRVTYVWRRVMGQLKLAHIHGSNAQDIPLNQLAPLAASALTADSSLFDSLRRLDLQGANGEKLAIRDTEGRHRLLFPDEILFLQAAGAYTVVHTETETFRASGLLAAHADRLPSQFRRIHKSYVVNIRYVDSLRRYWATLKDGRELPIGKERYMELKRSLWGTETEK